MTAGDYAAAIVAGAVVLLALIGAVVYGIRSGYTGTLTVGLKPKPAPKAALPTVTSGFNAKPLTEEQSRELARRLGEAVAN